jgi:hypothetical protein
MNWNPSGAAYKIYEKLVTKYYDRIITVRYYYLDGRSISFAFVWAGQEENYGQSMDIRVVLSSELDGLINGNIKSTAQADEVGKSLTASVKELEKFYGIDKYNLIDYTVKAKQDMEKSKVLANYNVGQKFNESVTALADGNGNVVFASNIVFTKDTAQPAAKCIIHTPYSWDKDTPVQELSPTEQFPDPKIRYGYFIGPCMIETITKNSQWQPSQKRQILSSSRQQQVVPKEIPTQGLPQSVVPQQSVASNAQAISVTEGSTGSVHATSRTKMRLEDNEDGETKKILTQEEHQCRLTTTLFMCPAVTGIKPLDIIFIPNYSGTFMEDWIVNSVEYSQTDGGVNISVQASRKFALGEFMNPKPGQEWLAKAKTYKLVGEGATLQDWMSYAWKLGGGGAAASNTSVSGGTSTPPAPKASDYTNSSLGGKVSGFTVGENANVA